MADYQTNPASVDILVVDDTRAHLRHLVEILTGIELHPEPFPIWTDSLQLRQVFINLLTNAVQAIEQEGCITISAKQLTGERSCVIEVEDNGTGIESNLLDNVFEPLYTTKATGTGLGLSICKQIIENHHGHIGMRSEKGQGTTVTIVLPEQEKKNNGAGTSRSYEAKKEEHHGTDTFNSHC